MQSLFWRDKYWKKISIVLMFLILMLLTCSSVLAESGQWQNAGDVRIFTLSDIIHHAMINSPTIKQAESNVAVEQANLKAAKSERFPKIELGGGGARYHYPTPVTPISGSPLAGVPFPEFSETIYDVGAFLHLPLYKGGRLVRNVELSELRGAAAADLLVAKRQDLIYNLTSVYYKILQLNSFMQSTEAQVRGLETHQRQVEDFFKAGKVAQVELLKAQVEVAKARENFLLAENSLKTTYELLRMLMGMEDPGQEFRIAGEPGYRKIDYSLEQALAEALKRRPEYLSVLKTMQAGEERVEIAKARRLPYVYLAGQYVETTGTSVDLKENWNAALRLSLPLFDGGLITAEIDREKAELEKVKQNERFLRLEINQEVKETFLSLENAEKRMEVASKAMESAKENLRVEELKYRKGASTTTNVVDAQTNLVLVETGYYQALYDRDIAIAGVRRAVGEDLSGEEQSK